jgi:LacI family transcriptional regulator
VGSRSHRSCSERALASPIARTETRPGNAADLSIVGFDDTVEAELMTRALTTVCQPLAEMGQMAVSLLVRLLEDQPIEALHVELATQLVVRDSTAELVNA